MGPFTFLIPTTWNWHVRDRNYPITGLDKLLGLQELSFPEFLENRHTKVAELSVLRAGRFDPAEDIIGIHFY